jgi:hypothetical protein
MLAFVWKFESFELAERAQAARSSKCTSRPIAVAMFTSASSETRDTLGGVNYLDRSTTTILAG